MRKPPGPPLTKLQLEILKEEDFADENGNLTPKGELVLHQLRTLDHWSRVVAPKREEKRKAKQQEDPDRSLEGWFNLILNGPKQP